jgi:hypothetical protein
VAGAGGRLDFADRLITRPPSPVLPKAAHDRESDADLTATPVGGVAGVYGGPALRAHEMGVRRVGVCNDGRAWDVIRLGRIVTAGRAVGVMPSKSVASRVGESPRRSRSMLARDVDQLVLHADTPTSIAACQENLA